MSNGIDMRLVDAAMRKSYDEWTDAEQEAMLAYDAEQERAEQAARLKAEGDARLQAYNERLREYDRRMTERERMKTASPVSYFVQQMQARPAATVYRIATTTEEAVRMLKWAYYYEVTNRGQKMTGTDRVCPSIDKVAEWLTADSHKPGLMLQGNVGVGKTTMLRSIKSVIDAMDGRRTLQVVTAWKLATMHKDDKKAYGELCGTPLLGIDDLGTEPRVVKDYGNDLTPLAELLTERYEKRLCTIITTNMGKSEIRDAYGERVYDRLCELCNTVTYPQGESFRQAGKQTTIALPDTENEKTSENEHDNN